MAHRYLLESSAVDGYLLESGTGVLLLEDGFIAGTIVQQIFLPPPPTRPIVVSVLPVPSQLGTPANVAFGRLNITVPYERTYFFAQPQEPVTSIETVTVDKWYRQTVLPGPQQWSPVQQALFVSPVTAVVVTPIAFATTTVTVPYDFTVVAPTLQEPVSLVAAPVTVDMWLTRPVAPQQLTRQIIVQQYPPFVEVIVLPLQQTRPQQALAQVIPQQLFVTVVTPVAPETVTVDKWYRQTVRPGPLPWQPMQQASFVAIVPAVVPFAFSTATVTVPYSFTVIAPTLQEPVPIVVVAPETITVDKWYRQTVLPNYDSGFQVVYSTSVSVSAAVAGTPDQIMSMWDRPDRRPPPPPFPTHLYAFKCYWPAQTIIPPPETVTVDKWYRQFIWPFFSTPERRPTQQTLPVVPVITPGPLVQWTWFVWPYFSTPRPTPIQQAMGDFTETIPPPVVFTGSDDWIIRFRRRRNR